MKSLFFYFSILALPVLLPAQSWTTYQSFPDNHIFGVGFQSDNSKWFSTRFGGASHFETSGWTVYDTTNGLADYYQESIHVDDTDNVYVGYGLINGISKFNGTSWSLINTPSDVYDMTIDSTGNLWITSFYYGGVSVYNGSSWTTYTTANGFPNDVVYAVAVDSLNNKWFGCSGSLLVKYDGNTFTSYTPPIAPPNSIVSAVTVDDSGYVWVGMYGEGLCRFDGTNWVTFPSTAGSTIMSIVFDHSGNLFYGGLGCGVWKYDWANWTNYTTVDGLGDNNIQSMGVSPLGEVWACSKYAGASVFNGSVTSASQENMSAALNVFPNPSSSFIHLENSTNEKTTVLVHDLSGKLVLQKESAEAIITIDISGLQSGTYLVSSGSKVARFIKY